MENLLERSVYICLLLWLLFIPVQGLEILNPEEVEYIRLKSTGVVGGSVTLQCGSILPSIFIWGYTKPGSESNVAVAFDYGQGPKLQPLSRSLGQIQVVSNTSSLVIDELTVSAEGLYTCQALFNTENRAKITFYFIQLDIQEK